MRLQLHSDDATVRLRPVNRFAVSVPRRYIGALIGTVQSLALPDGSTFLPETVEREKLPSELSQKSHVQMTSPYGMRGTGHAPRCLTELLSKPVGGVK